MKNANVFVDVDLTLVDANGKLLEERAKGCEYSKTRAAIFFFGQLAALSIAAKWRNFMG
jgi:hypothetical protein